MQLISKEKTTFELKPESLEDLWVLSQFIVLNDKIYATTQRKIKLGDDKTKTTTKIIVVDLLVKKSAFEHDILRVSGEIQNETEFTAIGQSHTLSFKVNDLIKVEKNNLLKYDEKLIEKTLKSKKNQNLIILLDKDEILAAEFGEYSYRILFSKDNLGSKKYHKLEINEEDEKFKILEEFLKKDYQTIIFSGPGTFKDNLKKYIENKTNLKILTFNWHDVSALSVQKVIKEISQSGILSENQISLESKYVSELLENIDKNSKATYGEKNTFNSIESGSVVKLLLTNKFIDKKRESGNFEVLNNKMKLCEDLNGEIVIINSKNEPGKIIEGLGGIAGILRY